MTGQQKTISLGRGAGASLLNVGYLAAQSLLFLVITPLLIRQLGAEEYGLWTILIAVLSTAGLANFGISTAVVKYVAQYGFSAETRNYLAAVLVFSLAFALLAGIVGTTLMWLFSDAIARSLSANIVPMVTLVAALRIVALTLTPLLVTQVAKGVLLGFVHNGLAGGITLVQQVVLLVGALAVSHFGGDLLDLAAWILLTNLVTAIVFSLSAYFIVRPLGLRFQWIPSLNRDVLRFSFFSWLSSIGSAMFASVDKVLVGIVVGPAAAGVYGVATGVAARLNMFAGAVTQVLVPVTSNYRQAGKWPQIRLIFLDSSRILACLLALLAVPLLPWMVPILSLWISPEFAADNTLVFQILIVCYALFSMQAAAYNMAYGLGKPYVPAIVGTGSALLVLGLIPILGPVFGLPGVAIANFGNMFTWFVVIIVARSIGLKPILTTIRVLGAPALVLLLSAAFAVFFAPSAIAIITLSLAAIGVLLLLLRGPGLRLVRSARKWRFVRPADQASVSDLQAQ